MLAMQSAEPRATYRTYGEQTDGCVAGQILSLAVLHWNDGGEVALRCWRAVGRLADAP